MATKVIYDEKDTGKMVEDSVLTEQVTPSQAVVGNPGEPPPEARTTIIEEKIPQSIPLPGPTPAPSPKPSTIGEKSAGDPGDFISTDKFNRPIFARGAQTPQEQIAMLTAVNPAAQDLKEWGRFVSDRAPTKAGNAEGRGTRREYREAVMPQAGSGNARFAMSVALAGADIGPLEDKKYGVDKDFDRYAAAWSRDPAGRKLIQDYGDAARLSAAKIQDAAQFASGIVETAKSVEEFADKVVESAGIGAATKSFSRRMATSLLTEDDKQTIRLNKQVDDLNTSLKKDAEKSGVVAAQYARVGNKLEVTNPNEVTESALRRAISAAEDYAKKNGMGVAFTRTADGFSVSMTSPKEEEVKKKTERERQNEELTSAITGGLFSPQSVMPMSEVPSIASSLSSEIGIAKPTGPVSVDTAPIDEGLHNSIAEFMANGISTGNLSATTTSEMLNRAIDSYADTNNLSRESVIKRLGTTEVGIQESLTDITAKLQDRLSPIAERRDEEVRAGAANDLMGIGFSVGANASPSFITETLNRLSMLDMQQNPAASDIMRRIAAGASPESVAAALAEVYRSTPSTGNAAQDRQKSIVVSTLSAIASGDPNAINNNRALYSEIAAGANRFSTELQKRRDDDMAASSRNPEAYYGFRTGNLSRDLKDPNKFVVKEVMPFYSDMSQESRQAFEALVPKTATGVVGVSGGSTYRADDIRYIKELDTSKLVAAAVSDKLGDYDAIMPGGTFSSSTANVVRDVSGTIMAGLSDVKEGKDTKAQKIDSALARNEMIKAELSDPALAGMVASGKPEQVRGAVARAAANAFFKNQNQVALDISKGYEKIAKWAEDNGVLTKGTWDSVSKEGITVEEARSIAETIRSKISKLSKETKSALAESYDENNTFEDIVNYTFIRGSDVSGSASVFLNRARSNVTKSRNQLGASPLGNKGRQYDDQVLNIDSNILSLLNETELPDYTTDTLWMYR